VEGAKEGTSRRHGDTETNVVDPVARAATLLRATEGAEDAKKGTSRRHGDTETGEVDPVTRATTLLRAAESQETPRLHPLETVRAVDDPVTTRSICHIPCPLSVFVPPCLRVVLYSVTS